MSVTDRLSSLFGSVENFHEAAKKGLWVGLFTALIGVVLIIFSGTIVASVGVSPSIGNGDSPAAAWLFSKLLGLVVTVLLIVPIVYAMRWITRRLDRDSSYAFTLVDPLLAISTFALAGLGLWNAVTVFDSLDLTNVETFLGFLMVSGVYLVFAGIGTEAAMAWIYSFTTLASFLKHLRVKKIISKMAKTVAFFWEWTRYPRLWYRYAAVTNQTLAGAALTLLQQGRNAVAEEIKPVKPTSKGSQQPFWSNRRIATVGVVVFASLIFVIQVRLAGGQNSPEDVAAWLILNKPRLGWTLSPFMHRGFLHYFRNIVLLGLVGYVIESHLRKSLYLITLLMAGYVGNAAQAGYMLLTEGGPVMVIGASGMMLMSITYAGFHLLLSHSLTPEIDSFSRWLDDYLQRLASRPSETLHGTMLYLIMVLGLVYPPFQIVNDWIGLFSFNTEVAGVAHLFGAIVGLSLAIAHHGPLSIGLAE